MSEDKKDENINSSSKNEENLEKNENQPLVDDKVVTSDDQKSDDIQNQQENMIKVMNIYYMMVQ